MRVGCTPNLDSSYEELLKEPWILDMDGTVKPLYGHKSKRCEDTTPPSKAGPSHVYQTYFIAAIRMVLDVEVQAGQSDGFHLRPAGIVGLAGSAAARAMAEAGAGGYRLGNRNHAGGL